MLSTPLAPPPLLPVAPPADATLRELSDLVKDVVPEARGAAASSSASRDQPPARPARLSFALVYPNGSGQHVMKEVGLVAADGGGSGGGDDGKTLAELGFQAGDMLDVAIMN